MLQLGFHTLNLMLTARYSLVRNTYISTACVCVIEDIEIRVLLHPSVHADCQILPSQEHMHQHSLFVWFRTAQLGF